MSLRLVAQLVRRLSLYNQPLKLLPVQLLLRKASFLFLLCLLILQKQNADEEVQEEETSNEDENDEEARLTGTEFILGAIVSFSNIDSLVHNVRPALKRSDDEKSHHSLSDVVKI